MCRCNVNYKKQRKSYKGLPFTIYGPKGTRVYLPSALNRDTITVEYAGLTEDYDIAIILGEVDGVTLPCEVRDWLKSDEVDCLIDEVNNYI